MAFGTPPAYMGFMGFARFRFPDSANDLIVRANSADVRLSQEIMKPDVIDGRWDKTVYQLGPKIVEGSVEYPAIMDRSTSADPTATLYKAAIDREFIGSRAGRLNGSRIFELEILYTTQSANFLYTGCIVNQWRFSAAQSDLVTVNVDLIGLDRKQGSFGVLTSGSAGFPQNSRIVTWQDVVVSIGGPDFNIDGAYMRTFEVTVNNDAERYYTFNRLLAPQDIAARKRDIDGSMSLMGRHADLAEHALNNQQRCFEQQTVQFGYNLTDANCQGVFLVTLPNIVFEIEEMALTNDIFETTVAWHCIPDDNNLMSSDHLQES